jgi:hypothetical protein
MYNNSKGTTMSGTSIFGDLVAAQGYNSILGTAASTYDPALDKQRAAQQQGMSQAQQQNLLAQQYTAALSARQHQWMVNGKSMDFAEFLDTICPDADDPQRTYLTLKYKGVK